MMHDTAALRRQRQRAYADKMATDALEGDRRVNATLAGIAWMTRIIWWRRK